jgi:hypothetical protein
MARKVLLGCGVLSSMLYMAANLLGARRWRDYRLASHTVSELSAIGAPSRTLVAPLLTAHGALVIPFGLGVWESARGRRGLRVTGALLMALGSSDLPAPLFPMHRREALARGERSGTDTMHIIVTSANSLLILPAIGFGSTALGRRFRVLLDRDHPGARRGRRFDGHASITRGAEPADAVGRRDRAHQHRRRPALAGGSGHCSLPAPMRNAAARARGRAPVTLVPTASSSRTTTSQTQLDEPAAACRRREAQAARSLPGTARCSCWASARRPTAADLGVRRGPAYR